MNRPEWMFDFELNATVAAGKQRFTLDAVCQSQARRLAIVGPSGAGKSLTLRLLAGLEKSTKSRICINGICYSDNTRSLPAQQRQVGLVFQDYALFPHLTVTQNIAFGLHQGLLNPRQTADADTSYWLKRMQLESVATHYPRQLSGGQRQRTALARACITRPRWLLLDEPFSALDQALRQDMRRLIHDLQTELAVPMLLISHDEADIAHLADDVALIQNGLLRHPR